MDNSYSILRKIRDKKICKFEANERMTRSVTEARIWFVDYRLHATGV